MELVVASRKTWEFPETSYVGICEVCKAANLGRLLLTDALIILFLWLVLEGCLHMVSPVVEAASAFRS